MFRRRVLAFVIQSGNWNPAIAAKLNKLLAGEPGLACFDFDNTMIRGDLGEATMYYILQQGLLGCDLPEFWSEIKHPALSDSEIDSWKKLWASFADREDEGSYIELSNSLINAYDRVANHSGLEEAYRWTRVIFCGMTEEELTKIAAHVFVENASPEWEGTLVGSGGNAIDTSIRVRPEIRDLIKAMRDKSWTVRIITASPECTIRPATGSFHLNPDDVRGLRLKKKGEILLPVIIEPMTFDKGKVQALRETTDAKIKFAAGDSFTDLAMLLDAESALLIDRGKPDLRKLAEEKGFWIQSADQLDGIT